MSKKRLLLHNYCYPILDPIKHNVSSLFTAVSLVVHIILIILPKKPLDHLRLAHQLSFLEVDVNVKIGTVNQTEKDYQEYFLNHLLSFKRCLYDV